MRNTHIVRSRGKKKTFFVEATSAESLAKTVNADDCSPSFFHLHVRSGQKIPSTSQMVLGVYLKMSGTILALRRKNEHCKPWFGFVFKKQNELRNGGNSTNLCPTPSGPLCRAGFRSWTLVQRSDPKALGSSTAENCLSEVTDPNFLFLWEWSKRQNMDEPKYGRAGQIHLHFRWGDVFCKPQIARSKIHEQAMVWCLKVYIAEFLVPDKPDNVVWRQISIFLLSYSQLTLSFCSTHLWP